MRFWLGAGERRGGQDKRGCAHLWANPLSAHRFRYAQRSLRCAHGSSFFLGFMGACGVHTEIKPSTNLLIPQSANQVFAGIIGYEKPHMRAALLISALPQARPKVATRLILGSSFCRQLKM